MMETDNINVQIVIVQETEYNHDIDSQGVIVVKLTSARTISLKKHPEVTEVAIQEFIFNDPSVLGLGDLSPIRREKIQPTKGRLDMLLGDEDTRYEVEIMLGATDPSHIIRTIEYWDSEKKRYPRYNHVAVIVAEDITARFLNVIGLFNGMIPLVALQMSATQIGDEISLNFVKVLDRNDAGMDDEEDDAEPTDRKYWEGRSNVLKFMDQIFADVSEYATGYELKYNKFYVGLAHDGVTMNFIYFRPKKKHMYLFIHIPENEETNTLLDQCKLEYDYISRDRSYRLRFDNIKDYEENKEKIKSLIQAAMEQRNLTTD